jgi:hypothetical protein
MNEARSPTMTVGQSCQAFAFLTLDDRRSSETQKCLRPPPNWEEPPSAGETKDTGVKKRVPLI